ncbi:hypothetical protein AB0280_00825 [Pseudarthrobacter sp902506025]|uniref:Uncharacterized protein n=1 Tax=Pseudarthrobacter defluvii TaxID=410837 RepID=A0ABT9UHA9_9MICC|nr:hypothetical protein [Pseudarthrobacter defluvii]MDQ0118406.1 hypothetical protein [Pseudarthrobacter defluvii]
MTDIFLAIGDVSGGLPWAVMIGPSTSCFFTATSCCGSFLGDDGE